MRSDTPPSGTPRAEATPPSGAPPSGGGSSGGGSSGGISSGAPDSGGPPSEPQGSLELLQLESLARLTDRLAKLIETRLWLKVLLAMLLGAGAGFALGPDAGWVPRNIAEPLVRWLALPGNLFLALIQMIVVPLVFASVVRGLTACDSMEQLRKIGLRAVAFFGATTAVATLIGIGAAYLVQPGRFVDASNMPAASKAAVPDAAADPKELPQIGELPDLIGELIPDNPLASMVGGQMLQVILFAVVVGVALLTMPRDRSAPLYDLLGSLQEVCMTVVKWAMSLAPLAVFGLTAKLTAAVGLDTLAGMGVYMATVLGGLVVLMVVYLIIVSVFGRKNPLAFLGRIREVALLAFSTSSSAAVMPLSIQTAREKLVVREATARFIVPLGATINMTGTALYQGVATVFLAQIFGIQLGPSEIVLVVSTAVAASIGSPATPGVGIVILAMVLGSVGIPTSGIALLLGVDRILDMSRTAVNVTGDLVACVVLDRSEDAAPASERREAVASGRG